MADRIAAAQRPAHVLDAADVSEHGLDVVVPGGRTGVEDPRDMPGGNQAIDDMRADEARAARDQDAHLKPI